MDAIEKKARELLAEAFDKEGFPKHAIKMRGGLNFTAIYQEVVVSALIDALMKPTGDIGIPTSVPDGFALVPVEPTEEMYAAAAERVKKNTVGWGDGTLVRDPVAHAWIAMLAARPEVP